MNKMAVGKLQSLLMPKIHRVDHPSLWITISEIDITQRFPSRLIS